MARRCGTRNNPCPYPRASWWRDFVNGGNEPSGDWILATGFWEDAGFWRDDELWID